MLKCKYLYAHLFGVSTPADTPFPWHPDKLALYTGAGCRPNGPNIKACENNKTRWNGILCFGKSFLVIIKEIHLASLFQDSNRPYCLVPQLTKALTLRDPLDGEGDLSC